MSQVFSHLPAGGAGSGCPRNSLNTNPAAGTVSQQSVRTSERLAAGLTIRTREGDLVTLSSSSYSSVDAWTYDSRGSVTTPGQTAAGRVSYREITLTSGHRFSFSVQGSLSADELADIDRFVSDIDGIIYEMTSGDMDEAVARALSMAGYDTISQYSADLSYQRSYQAVSAYSRYQTGEAWAGEPEPSLTSSGAAQIEARELMERIREQIERTEERLLEKVRTPVRDLIGRHAAWLKEERPADEPAHTALGQLAGRLDRLIDDFLGQAFKRKPRQLA